MQITDDVIRDLLPLYLAGEASPATRELVAAYLAEHPDLATEAQRAVSWSLPPVAREDASAKEAERLALRRTKRLLARRTWTLGWAILFTVLPLSFAFDTRTGFDWVFWPEHATMATVSLALGAAGWIVFAMLDRKLRPRGF